jgi:hypothetical protein
VKFQNTQAIQVNTKKQNKIKTATNSWIKNGQRTEQTFLKRRQTNGQHVYRKVLNINNLHVNENSNHNEMLHHAYQYGYYPKMKKQQVLVRM